MAYLGRDFCRSRRRRWVGIDLRSRHFFPGSFRRSLRSQYMDRPCALVAFSIATSVVAFPLALRAGDASTACYCRNHAGDAGLFRDRGLALHGAPRGIHCIAEMPDALLAPSPSSGGAFRKHRSGATAIDRDESDPQRSPKSGCRDVACYSLGIASCSGRDVASNVSTKGFTHSLRI